MPPREGFNRFREVAIGHAPESSTGNNDSPREFFDKHGLMAEALTDAILASVPLAVHPSDELWRYENGCYRRARQAISWEVQSRLGNRFRPDHLRTFLAFAAGKLTAQAKTLDPDAKSGLVNVTNGMLDPLTGLLHPHDPSYLSVAQLHVEWQPNATCPTFDKWFISVVPSASRRQDLVEDTGFGILDLTKRRQKRTIYLIGFTRTGKSTFTRIVRAVVGPENCSSEELIALATNRFRAAELYGKLLNEASDIRAEHLRDLSLFKKATGQDRISAERKYGQPFQFEYGGMFAYTMNTVPTIEEASDAYLARIRPYRFNESFEGHEDPSMETAIIGQELPGVLVRLVEGYQRLVARGGYSDNEDSRSAAAYLARQSDAVRLFLDEQTRPGGHTPRTTLWTAFDMWAKDQHRAALGRNQFYEAARTALGGMATLNGVRGFRVRLVSPWDEEDPEADPGAESAT